MIELSQFVSDALSQIVEGIADAQKRAIDRGAVINPRASEIVSSRAVGKGDYCRLVEDIEFDVAVTTAEGTKIAGKVGVLAAVMGAGIGAESTGQAQSISRIKFKIPIAFPLADLADERRTTKF